MTERGASTAGGCPVVAAFEACVDATPAAEAVILDSGSVTFGALDAAANGVAQALLDLVGGEPEPVQLMIRDPARMLAAMLGVLKAGAYYAPVNPGYPPARLDAVQAQLRGRVAFVDGDTDAPDGLELVDVSRLGDAPRRTWPTVDSGSPAYALFTSGSTGVPKAISHNRSDMWHNVIRHAPLGIGPTDRVSLVTADGFVAAVSNVYIALLNGAALAPYAVYDGGIDDLLPWLRRSGVTVCYAFPSFVRQAAALSPGNAPQVRLVYLGGEPVHASDVSSARTLAPGATVAVGLNSTETGLTRLHLISPDAPAPDPVPVGGPVADVEVLVLDGDEQAAPGAIGDIVVRSRYVAPSLVEAGSFVPLTTSAGEDGRREIRTGDRGRMSAEGELFHVGRSDGMVKVRGFRIEISEVERALLSLPDVSEAVVVPCTADALTTELSAHVVAASSTATAAGARAGLARLLPSSSVPSRIWVEDSLPRLPNGKVDRAALSRLAADRIGAAPVEPEPEARAADDGSVRGQLTMIWCETLGLASATSDSDFFDEGGTSLTALRLVSAVRRQLDVPLRLAVVFETPMLEALIDEVTSLLETADAVAP